MDAIEAPSFSLGFDFDLDTESQPPFQNPDPVTNQSKGKQKLTEEESDDEELWGPVVMDTDPESGSDPPRVFKRLRRCSVGAPIKETGSVILCDDDSLSDCDDDIEEFCSDEDPFVSKDKQPSKQLRSVSSSSKVPLRASGVLSTQPSSHSKSRKREHGSNASGSASVEASHHGFIFPKLTISPLRKFLLIESDSEDHSGDENVGKKVLGNTRQPMPSNQKSIKSTAKVQNKDLWKDFCPVKSLTVPTPALDEFCKKYSLTVNDKDKAKPGYGACINQNKSSNLNNRSAQKFEQCWDSTEPLPPAHRYFFHDDPRIQELVCSRLPNFIPLGVIRKGDDKSSPPLIDYLGQFATPEASKQKGPQKNTRGKNSTRRRNRSRRSNAEEGFHVSEDWVNPKSSALVQDAGRKRVHGSGSQSAGHWYTSPEGRKVYVSKSGKELTGQIAYRHYRKETGRAFNKSKKKPSAKKKKS